jgi:hypothetical protein
MNETDFRAEVHAALDSQVPAGLADRLVQSLTDRRKPRLASRLIPGVIALVVFCVAGIGLLTSIIKPGGAPTLGGTALATTSPTSAAASPSVQPSVGSLVVSPSSGRVGATVTLDGQGCNIPGQPATFFFGNQGDLSGTLGVVDIPNVAVDSSGRFHIVFVVPSNVHGYQGRGGGSVAPGLYEFGSLPPYCQATFQVQGQ